MSLNFLQREGRLYISCAAKACFWSKAAETKPQLRFPLSPVIIVFNSKTPFALAIKNCTTDSNTAVFSNAGPKDVTQKRQLSAGEILKLRCVTDVVNREVQWIIPETTVNSSKWELSTKPLDRNDGTYYRSTLRVFNVNSFDTGFYTCAIQESRDSSKNRSQPSRKRGRVVSGSKVDKAVKRNYVYVYGKFNGCLCGFYL